MGQSMGATRRSRRLFTAGAAFAVLGVGVALWWRRGPDPPAPLEVREIDNPFRDGLHVVRIVDEETGKGIAGAWLRTEGESLHPLGALLEGDPLARSDEEGLLSAAPEDLFNPWAYVGADGYATADVANTQNDELVLRRGRDFPVRLLDPVGEPVVGGILAWRIGCGHASDLFHAVTGTDGIAILEGIDPSEPGWAWPVAEGILGEDLYFGGSPEGVGWMPGDPPLVVHASPAPTIEGRVLGDEERPVVGAYVGGGGWHRGPWTRTDAEGAFRILGGEDLFVALDEDSANIGRTYPPPPGTPLVVRLRAGRLVDPERVPWTVRVVERTTREPVERVRLQAARLSDGVATRFSSGDTDPAGTEVLLVAPGEQVLCVGDDVSEIQPTRIEARVEGPTDMTVEVEWAPLLPVDMSRLPDDVEVRLQSRTASRKIPRTKGIATLRAPRGVRLALRVGGKESWDPAVLVPVPAERNADSEPIRLTWPSPSTIRVRVADEDGRPAPSFVHPSKGQWGREGEPVSEAEMPVTAPGTWLVVVRPVRRDLAAVAVAAFVPSAFGARVDLGEVRLPARASRRVTVVDPKGAPDPDARVRLALSRLLQPWAGSWWAWAPSEEDEEKDEEDRPFLDPAPGMTIHVESMRKGIVPMTVRLDGEGPWTIRRPGCGIDILAREADGTPVAPFGVRVDGFAFEGAEGRCEVRGLAAGRHRVLVYRDDRPRAVEARVRLAEGEVRTLEVTLPPPARKPGG